MRIARICWRSAAVLAASAVVFSGGCSLTAQSLLYQAATSALDSLLSSLGTTSA